MNAGAHGTRSIPGTGHVGGGISPAIRGQAPSGCSREPSTTAQNTAMANSTASAGSSRHTRRLPPTVRAGEAPHSGHAAAADSRISS